MNEAITGFRPTVERYNALMDIVRNRFTTRAFRPDIAVPREHIEMVLEAARHAPSGANAQPWHYIVVTQPEAKKKIADYFKISIGELVGEKPDAAGEPEELIALYRGLKDLTPSDRETIGVLMQRLKTTRDK